MKNETEIKELFAALLAEDEHIKGLQKLPFSNHIGTHEECLKHFSALCCQIFCLVRMAGIATLNTNLTPEEAMKDINAVYHKFGTFFISCFVQECPFTWDGDASETIKLAHDILNDNKPLLEKIQLERMKYQIEQLDKTGGKNENRT